MNPLPLYARLSQTQLARACELIASGIYTVEAAFGKVCKTSRQSVYRGIWAGEAAAEKLEAGGTLTELELQALAFQEALAAAQADRTARLTSWALGLKPDGKRDGRSESGNALSILRLTVPEFREPPKKAVVMERIEAGAEFVTLSNSELEQLARGNG
jgi:hypothetical protein